MTTASAHYLSHSDALKYVQREAGLSREIFDQAIRPRLLERKYGERVIRFSRLAIDQALADPSFEEGAMKLLRRKTLADALEHVWETEWQFQKGSKSQRRLVDAIIRERGDRVLKRIGYEDLESWVTELRERKLKDATIARRLSAVMKALRRGRAKGWVADIPEKPPLSVDNYQDRYLTYEEEALLLDGATNPVMRHAIGFLLDTGCRLSELMRLRPGDIQDDGVIFRDRKGGGHIKVPLTARARDAARWLHANEWWQHWTRNVHDRDKAVRDTAMETLRTRLSHEFGKVRKQAGLTDVSIHTCRHTCGSRLAQAGVPMHMIQAFLGHKDISVTSKRYAHLAPSSLLGTLKALERPESNNVVPIGKQRKNGD